MECVIVIFFNFWVFLNMYIFEVTTFYLAYYLSNQLSFFSGSMYLKIHVFNEGIFLLSNRCIDDWKNVFFLYLGQRLRKGKLI